MKLGDLVRVKISEVRFEYRKRRAGVIIKFEVYNPKSSWPPELMAEVLWEGGLPSWILNRRIELIHEVF